MAGTFVGRLGNALVVLNALRFARGSFGRQKPSFLENFRTTLSGPQHAGLELCRETFHEETP